MPEVEAGVFLSGERKQPVPSEALGEGTNIDKVPRLRASEQGKHLVRRELFQGEHRSDLGSFVLPDARVPSQVNLAKVVAVPHLKTHEAVPALQDPHLEPFCGCDALNGVRETRHRLGSLRR